MVDTTPTPTSTSIWYDLNEITAIIAIVLIIIWAWSMIKFNNKKNKY